MSATTRKIKGKLKELEGKVTGDKLREAQGRTEKTAGKIGTAVKSRVRRAKARALKTKAGRKAAAAKATP
ncbi:MAG TPA: CsbD family protein [Kofleriaceae bacterium]|jgi:uncharacterized protein YjbJ (UPF0337 family)